MPFPGNPLIPGTTPTLTVGYQPDLMPGGTTLPKDQPTPGNIFESYEADGYTVQLEAGVVYTATAYGASHGQILPDPFIGVGDYVSGQMIATADSGPDGSPDPVMVFNVPVSGTYWLAITDISGGTGTYALALQDQAGNNAPSGFAFDYQVQPPPGWVANPFPQPNLPGFGFGVLGVQESADPDLSPFG